MNYKQNLDIWLNSSIDESHKKEINKLSEKEKKEAFYENLSFGTAGIRGIRGIGSNRINIYNIRMYSYAFGKFLVENSHVLKSGVAIAYDNRFLSKEFSLESAKVFGTFGIKTYLFAKERPTPQLSWTIRNLKLAGGLVLTASHNPKEYNGYKMYDESGGQIVQDKMDKYLHYLEKEMNNFDIPTLSLKELEEQKLLEYLDEDYDQGFIKDLTKLPINPVKKQTIKVAYSAQNGASNAITMKLFEKLGLEVYSEMSQAQPDPNFTNSPMPNPEEEKAFDKLKELGHKINADLLLSTDPDGDRFGICVLHNNKYVFLNGNQMAALLLDYIISQKIEKNILGKDPYVVNSYVTSSLGRLICEKYGVKLIKTLTGFKWIGGYTEMEIAKGYENIICAYEESSGFMFSSMAREKDSLQACLMMIEMSQFYKNKNKTLIDRLEELGQEFGYHKQFVKALVLKGIEGIEKIRGCIKFLQESKFEDFLSLGFVRYDNYEKAISFTKDNQKLIELPTSKAFKFYFNDYDWITIRPSGTEPKIKAYFCLKAKTKEELEEKYKKAEKQVKALFKKGGIDQWN